MRLSAVPLCCCFGTLVAVAFAAAPRNEAWLYVKRPAGAFDPQECFKKHDIGPPPPIGPGEVRAASVALSTQPTYRGQMGQWRLGLPPRINVVARVVESNSDAYPVGSFVEGHAPLQRYFKFKGAEQRYRIANVSEQLPAEKYLSVLCMGAGLTAWHIVENTASGRVEKPCSATVVVTSAASATGMVVGQLYKLKGCKVIGVTSTHKKADRLRHIGGFDHLVAYREEDLAARLRELAPEGVDLDIELVGGKQLEVIAPQMKLRGKIVICGVISDYDKSPADHYGFKHMGVMIMRRLTMEGILVTDMTPPQKKRAYRELGDLVRGGLLRSEETVVHGFDRWPGALRRILDGDNVGRLAVLLEGGGPRPRPGKGRGLEL